MGQEIEQTSFGAHEQEKFRARLRHETKTLKRWFDEQAFEQSSTPTTGLELEAWLTDENLLPAPQNDRFIAIADDARIVPELSRFNFELNVDPRPLADDFLRQTRRDLESLWGLCEAAAAALNLAPVAIGILPTVRDEMLQPAWMSESNRYRALSQELLRLRNHEPLHVLIDGDEQLDLRCNHIMLEAACTSLQAHLQVNQDDAVRSYNASIIAAGPLVAATANSPFLYGKSLWSETRIPAFEQATAVHGFRDVTGRDVLRVTLGTDYLRHSMLEWFLENLAFPVLLPVLVEQRERLPHLRLQNGTIWRWVRPILGFNADGQPHLRIEQRVMPAGPSIVDTVANLALSFGLTLALATEETPPESQIPFEDARNNFYACSRDGLAATVRWQGRRVGVQTLLHDELLPRARRALDERGVSRADLVECFDDILLPRLQSGRTGSQWQRSYCQCNGSNFQALTQSYLAWQRSGRPVHDWTV